MTSKRREFESQIEHIIHTSEILAVARALQSGDTPHVGQTIDYYLELKPPASLQLEPGLQSKVSPIAPQSTSGTLTPRSVCSSSRAGPVDSPWTTAPWGVDLCGVPKQRLG